MEPGGRSIKFAEAMVVLYSERTTRKEDTIAQVILVTLMVRAELKSSSLNGYQESKRAMVE